MDEKGYAFLFKECKELLADEGLLVPRTKLRITDGLMSYTDNPYEIHLGLWVRTFGDPLRIRHAMLHELMHILVFRIPPSKEIKGVFGTPEAWEEDQNKLRWLLPHGNHISRYAQTHPEEDLVETAVFLLERYDEGAEWCDEDAWFVSPTLDKKIRVVEEWFESIRNRRKRGRA